MNLFLFMYSYECSFILKHMPLESSLSTQYKHSPNVAITLREPGIHDAYT